MVYGLEATADKKILLKHILSSDTSLRDKPSYSHLTLFLI